MTSFAGGATAVAIYSKNLFKGILWKLNSAKKTHCQTLQRKKSTSQLMSSAVIETELEIRNKGFEREKNKDREYNEGSDYRNERKKFCSTTLQIESHRTKAKRWQLNKSESDNHKEVSRCKQ